MASDVHHLFTRGKGRLGRLRGLERQRSGSFGRFELSGDGFRGRRCEILPPARANSAPASPSLNTRRASLRAHNQRTSLTRRTGLRPGSFFLDYSPELPLLFGDHPEREQTVRHSMGGDRVAEPFFPADQALISEAAEDSRQPFTMLEPEQN